jgi:hypothetical protein
MANLCILTKNVIMQEFIITTPDQLRTVISEAVKEELAKQLLAHPSVERKKHKGQYLLTKKQLGLLLYRFIRLLISLVNYYLL